MEDKNRLSARRTRGVENESDFCFLWLHPGKVINKCLFHASQKQDDKKAYDASSSFVLGSLRLLLTTASGWTRQDHPPIRPKRKAPNQTTHCQFRPGCSAVLMSAPPGGGYCHQGPVDAGMRPQTEINLPREQNRNCQFNAFSIVH